MNENFKKPLKLNRKYNKIYFNNILSSHKFSRNLFFKFPEIVFFFPNMFWPIFIYSFPKLI